MSLPVQETFNGREKWNYSSVHLLLCECEKWDEMIQLINN